MLSATSLRVARVAAHVLEHERRARREHPAGDPLRRREALADEVLLALVRDRGEHELVGLLVEQEDRRRLRAEDRARDDDDRAQELGEVLFRRQHGRGDRGFEAFVAHLLASHVRRDQVQHGLHLERRQAGVLAEHERGDRRSVPASRSCCRWRESSRRRATRLRRRRRARRTRPADRGSRRRRAGRLSSWLPTETTDEKRHGYDSTGMLCADAISIVRWK